MPYSHNFLHKHLIQEECSNLAQNFAELKDKEELQHSLVFNF